MADHHPYTNMDSGLLRQALHQIALAATRAQRDLGQLTASLLVIKDELDTITLIKRDRGLADIPDLVEPAPDTLRTGEPS